MSINKVEVGRIYKYRDSLKEWTYIIVTGRLKDAGYDNLIMFERLDSLEYVYNKSESSALRDWYEETPLSDRENI